MGLNPAELIRGITPALSGSHVWESPSLEELAKLLPQYEISAVLGRGGMGAVYLGSQTELRREVAIKLLPAELSKNPEFTERFLREARALALLDHPNIVRIHDLGKTDEGHLYFVMEYINGANLQSLLSQNDVSVNQSINYILQICEALSHAHQKGIIHRDIKPANILIDEEGKAKLVDFGLVYEKQAEFPVTMTNVSIGTPDFMAPEQYEGEGEADERSDIFSLGLVLYYSLTDKLPRGDWERPSSLKKYMVRGIDPVVSKSLQQNPENRYQTIGEFSDALSKLKKLKRSPAIDTPLRSAKKYWIYLLACAFCLSAFYFVTRDKNESAPSPTAAHNQMDVVYFKEFKNSMGMNFVPLKITDGSTKDQQIFFATHELRRSEYRIFAKETKTEWWDASWGDPDFKESSDHPAVIVTFRDAVNFSNWLTLKERALGIIGKRDRYRPPTELEWLSAAGEMNDLPKANDGSIKQKHTLTVGSSAPNDAGIYDLNGNVTEWCSLNENVDDLSQYLTMGESWGSATSNDIYKKESNSFDAYDYKIGIRLVLHREQSEKLLTPAPLIRFSHPDLPPLGKIIAKPLSANSLAIPYKLRTFSVSDEGELTPRSSQNQHYTKVIASSGIDEIDGFLATTIAEELTGWGTLRYSLNKTQKVSIILDSVDVKDVQYFHFYGDSFWNTTRIKTKNRNYINVETSVKLNFKEPIMRQVSDQKGVFHYLLMNGKMKIGSMRNFINTHDPSRLKELREYYKNLNQVVDLIPYKNNAIILRADGITMSWNSRFKTPLTIFAKHQGEIVELRYHPPLLFAKLTSGKWVVEALHQSNDPAVRKQTNEALTLLKGFEHAEDLVFRQLKQSYLTVRLKDPITQKSYWVLLRKYHPPLKLEGLDEAAKVFPGEGYVMGMQPVL